MLQFHKIIIHFFIKCILISASTPIKEITTSQTPININLDNIESWIWSVEQPYSSKSSLSVFVSSNNYKIGVTVSDIDIDGDNHDYLSIKGENDNNGRVFTQTLKGPIKMYFDSYQVFGKFMVVGTNPNNHKGFNVLFERVEKPTTTTTSPITTTPQNNFPTTQRGEFGIYTVYITGRTATQFKNKKILKDFRKSLVQMATKYCNLENMYLKENITEQNVLIKQLMQCPTSWYESDDCTQITFALPIILDENRDGPWYGYQMNTGHLEIMWQRYAKFYFTVYEKMDTDLAVVWWGIAISMVTVLFVVFLFIIRATGGRYSTLTKRRFSDATSIISRKKDSTDSLGPHYLQEIPKFFDNRYSMYHPGEDEN